MSLTLCAVQYTPQYRRTSANVDALIELITEAARNNDRPLIFCLPEMCTSGYIFRSQSDIAPYCESAQGPSFKAFSDFCRRESVYCAYGFAESDGAHLYNSQNFISNEGKLLRTYRKVHLFQADTLWAQPGNGYVFVDTEFGRIGLGICMDLNYNEFVDWHISQHTQIMLFSTNWLDQGVDIRPYWRERLAGYGGIFVAANRSGDEFGIPFIGTTVIMHNGEILSQRINGAQGIILYKYEYE